MAKKYQKKPQNSAISKKKSKGGAKTPKYEDFKDVVLDARQFLKEGSNPDSDLEFDDEELDSDEAWGEDDYDVLDNKFSQTTRDNKKKNPKSILKASKSSINEYGEDEEEEGWSSVEEGELITLSEAWDRDDRELRELESAKLKKSKKNELVLRDDEQGSSASEEESTSEEEEEEEEEESSEEEVEEDPFDEMNISDSENELGNVMAKLSKHLPQKEKERKVLVNDKTNESQFALPTEGGELDFDDMLLEESADENDKNDKNDLTTDVLKSKNDDDTVQEERDYHGRVVNKKTGAFAVPLPSRIQKRQERRAAYEIQRDDVNKWRDVIDENRDKDILDFRPAKIEQNKMAAFTLDDKPVNDLESKLDSILKESNLEEKKTEDLFNNIQTAKLSKADMLKRTKELRMMRELMYRNERDAKRLKKIKSKSYRKQLRKDKDKEHALMQDLEENENEDDADYLRAKERMTLKHKNTSNWAKSMIKSGISKDKESRSELEEMMRQSDRLRQKQLANQSEEEDDRDLSDIERDVNDENDVDDEQLSKLGKGVLAMDFMKNAAEKEKVLKLQQIKELKESRQSDGKELFENNDDSLNNGVNVTINSGRRIYTPSALNASNESNQINDDIQREIENDESKSLLNKLKPKEVIIREETFSDSEHENGEEAEEEQEVNPWLDEGDAEEENYKASKKSSKVSVLDKNSKQGDKFQSRIKKDLEKQENKSSRKSKSKETNDEIAIETNQTLNIVDSKREQNKKKRAAEQSDDEFEAEAQGEDEIYMFKQEDLIKQAFAGDDLIQEEFSTEKLQIEKLEDDQEIEESMPGWGSWAGDANDDSWGFNKSNKKRKIVRKVQGVTSKGKRSDKGKEKVIINERVTKASMKYQADKIPYPFKTWDEYEKSLRMPLGKEWVSDSTFQKMTTPDVITRFGSVINPLKAPFKE